MKTELRYQAAEIVSSIVENHFSQHLAKAQERGEEDLATLPSARLIETILNIAFWASLRKEEGNSPKISLAFLSPEQTDHKILFEHKIPLNSNALTKISLGVEGPGIHLGVWHEDHELYIWGTAFKIPNLCFILDVSEPGLLVIKHRRIHGFGKFTNVAVLTGDQIKIVDEKSSFLPDSPVLLKSLLGHSIHSNHTDESVNILIQLAVSMRAHKHGGILLIIPEGSDTWRESIIQPIKYSIVPSYAGVTSLINQETKKHKSLWQNSLRRELDSIAGLTAIDGATLINDRFELLGFGAKISRANGKERVEKVLFHEPIIGSQGEVINPTLNGGTRHLASAQFVNDQRESIALVASQDGHFTIFSWSSTHDMVQSHRIDTLLL